MSQQEALRAPVSVSHDAGFELQLPLAAGAARAVDDDWEDVVIDPQFVPPPEPPQPGRRLLAVSLVALQQRLLGDAPAPAPAPVQGRPLVFRSASGVAATWMHARRAARAAPAAPPPAPAGVLFAAAPPAAAAKTGAVLVEAWR
jgi:hypothetical protein